MRFRNNNTKPEVYKVGRKEQRMDSVSVTQYNAYESYCTTWYNTTNIDYTTTTYRCCRPYIWTFLALPWGSSWHKCFSIQPHQHTYTHTRKHTFSTYSFILAIDSHRQQWLDGTCVPQPHTHTFAFATEQENRIVLHSMKHHHDNEEKLVLSA